MKRAFIYSIFLVISLGSYGQITKQPKDTIVCKGGNAKFSVNVTNIAVSFRWHKWNGTIWDTLNDVTPYSGVFTKTLVIKNVHDTLNSSLFKCKIDTNKVSINSSDSAKLSVNSLPTASIKGSTSVCQNASPQSITLEGANGTAPYTFRYKINGVSQTPVTTTVGNSVKLTVPTNNAGNYTYSLFFVVDASTTACAQTQSDSASITVNPLPTATISASVSSVCQNASSPNITFTGVNGTNPFTFTYKIGSGSPQTIKTTSGNSVNLPVPTNISGSFTYTLISVMDGSSTNCIQSQSGAVTVTVNALPTASIAGSTNVCQNTSPPSISLLGANGTAPYTFNYKIDGVSQTPLNTPSGSSNASLTVSTGTPRTSIYSLVSVVDANGCSQTQSGSATITIYRLPSINSQPINSTKCEGTNTTFSVGAIGTGLTYVWQVNKGTKWDTIANAGSNPIYSNWNSATLGVNSLISWNNKYQYRCIVSGTCSPSVTSNPAVLYVNVTPAISSHPNNSSVCEGGSAVFQINANGTNLKYQWQVDPGSGFKSPTGTNPKYSDDTTSRLQLSSIVTGNNGNKYRCIISNKGCISDTSRASVLTVNVNPSVKAGNDSSVCLGSTILLTPTVTANSPKYNWSPSTGLSDSKAKNPTASPTTFTVYTLSVYDINNCVNSSEVKIYVKSLPKAVITPSGALTFCNGSNVYLNANTGSGLKYDWRDGGNKQIWKDSSSYKAITSGFYKVLITNSGNCTDSTSSIKVTVNPNPIIDAGKDDKMCLGGKAVQLSAFTAITNTILWSPSFGLNNTKIYNPNANPSSTTVYTVLATDVNNCSSSDTVKVTVNALPNANAGYDTVMCEGDIIRLHATGGFVYKWNHKTDLSSDFIDSPLAFPKSTTIFRVRVTDKNNCSDSDEVRIVVYSKPKSRVIGDTVCYGESAQLYASGGVFFNWSNSLELDFNNIATPKVKKSLISKKYYVIVGDINNCKTIDSALVLVNQLPNINIQTKRTSICIGDSIILNGRGGVKYSWTPNSWLNKDNDSIIISRPTQNITYNVIGTNEENCTNTSNIEIKVNPLPSANAGKDTVICEKSSITLIGKGGNKYQWTPNLYLFGDTTYHPIFSPKDSMKITYTLTVTDINNCVKKDDVQIKVLKNPTPRISGLDTVCKNAYWVEFRVDKTPNTFQWSVNNDNVITTGQGSNLIKVHWGKNSSKGLVSVTETLKETPGCSSTVSKSIIFSNTTAVDPAIIVAKANNLSTNILICQLCNYKNYEWGYEPKSNPYNEITQSTGNTWCNYSFIDTFNFYYWVKVSDGTKCLTKSYYNKLRISSIKYGDLKNIISIYPNPTKMGLKIISPSKVEAVEIYNLIGEIVLTQGSGIINENNNYIDLSKFPKGIYFMNLKTSNGIITKKIIKE